MHSSSLQVNIMHLDTAGKQGTQDRETEMIPTLWNVHSTENVKMIFSVKKDQFEVTWYMISKYKKTKLI